LYAKKKTKNQVLLFDPEIERTVRRNNSKNRKHKQLMKRQQQEQAEVADSNSKIWNLIQ